MLSINIEKVTADNQRHYLDIGLVIGRCEPARTLVVLQRHDRVIAKKMLFDYNAMCESGIVAAARAFNVLGDKIDEVFGISHSDVLHISIKGMPINAIQPRQPFPSTSYLSIVPRKTDLHKPRLGASSCVEILVEEYERGIASLCQRACELAAATDIDYVKFPTEPVVPIYSGKAIGHYLLICELPKAVAPWFLAYAKQYMPDTIYDDGRVATYAAWKAFLRGESMTHRATFHRR